MLWLIRHGESVSNAGEKTENYARMPLTPRGQTQAEQIAQAFPQPPDHILLSPYFRAQQTAAPLMRKYPNVPVGEAAVQEFTYLDSDRCRDLNLTGRQPLVDAYWDRMDPAYCDGGNSESYSHFARRVRSFLAHAATGPGWRVVFTHAQFIRGVVLATLWGDLPDSVESMRAFYAMREWLPVPNGSILRLEHRHDRWWNGGLAAVG